LNGGQVQGSGAVFSAATLNIGPAAGAGLLILRGTCTLDGNVGPGQTLWVNGSPTGGSGYLQAAAGVTNAGTLRLESSGGQRQFSADLDSQGSLTINAPTAFTKCGGVYANSRSLTIASGQSLAIASGNQIFKQSGGTLDAQGEFRLTAVPFNYHGGEVRGKPGPGRAPLPCGGPATSAAMSRITRCCW